MITLVKADPDFHWNFELQKSQLVLRWRFWDDADAEYLSDWHAVSEAHGLDPFLLKEFTACRRAFFDQVGMCNDRQTIDSYFAWAKSSESQGPLAASPDGTAKLHQAYRSYTAADRAMAKQMMSLHPSARFCTLQRKNGDAKTFYVFCERHIWSSDEWLPPRAWLEHVSRLVPASQTQTPGSSRLITVEVRREVWRRDQGKCTICGSSERLELDHVIPVSKGGSNTVRNIQLLCESCNRRKGAEI